MTATHSPAQLAALNALKFDLQVKSELNDPAIRRQFKEGNGIDNKIGSYYAITNLHIQINSGYVTPCLPIHDPETI